MVIVASVKSKPPFTLRDGDSGVCEHNTTFALRPVRLLRVWISEGLTQADS